MATVKTDLGYIKGDKGDKGDVGSTPTIKASAGAHINETGTPSVTTSTSDNTATFTFDYLKGAKGDKGDKGDKGKDGTNGKDGANGKSAYEIAKANGFTGTEAQWVSSLKGEKGDKGDTPTDYVKTTDPRLTDARPASGGTASTAQALDRVINTDTAHPTALNRPLSISTKYGDGKLRILHVTSSLTDKKEVAAKPGGKDAIILQAAWDNATGTDAQIAVLPQNTGDTRLYIRSGKQDSKSGADPDGWFPWKRVLTEEYLGSVDTKTASFICNDITTYVNNVATTPSIPVHFTKLKDYSNGGALVQMNIPPFGGYTFKGSGLRNYSCKLDTPIAPTEQISFTFGYTSESGSANLTVAKGAYESDKTMSLWVNAGNHKINVGASAVFYSKAW